MPPHGSIAVAGCAAAALAGIAGCLSGCAVGPEYHRPAADLPARWAPDAAWHEAEPADARIKGDWWKNFHDPLLDPLVDAALQSNQNLRVAAARLDQARDQYAIARADLFPSVSAVASAARSKDSSNRPLSAYSVPNQSVVQNDFRIGPSISYEVDLFGRVRREVEGARATAEQAEADFENTRLMLLTTLVSDYFSLRELDAEIGVVRRSLALQQSALDFVSARHDLGFATGLDLAQQQALYESSAAELELLRNQRAQVEHGIATLIGTPAPVFSLPASEAAGALPALPVGLPSDLLQRRPDVASAERAMAAANARIGVARAAYFPSINLAPGAFVPALGWESNAVSHLIEAPSLLWSIGLSATQTLFDAGRASAGVRFATADYAAAVAGYRQTVLSAMEEVENGITGLITLDRAARQSDASVASAQRAYDIASDRYKGGVDTYLDVITAQQTLLTNQRQAAQIQGQQFATAVYLVKALGGGWRTGG
jgi:NodT family efflux transporter outer membrane factor (OMF) lipoprotein